MATATVPIPQGAMVDDEPTQQQAAPGSVPIPDGATIDAPDYPGLDSEEQQFLQQNSDKYQYLPQDSRFPNRQPGIYPKGPGNEWRDDANSPMAASTQMPVDLHLGTHLAEGAGEAAAETSSALIPEAVSALAPALTRGIIGVGQWAEENPKLAKAIWEGIKLTTYGGALIRGLHKAVDIGGK